MHTLEIDIDQRRHTFRFPEKHSEFSRHHLKVLNRVIESSEKDPLIYVRMVKDMLRLPRKVWRKLEAEELFWCEIDENNNVEMIPELKFLLEIYSNHKSLVYRVGPFRGPKDQLKNVSLEQVGFTDMFANAYAEDPSSQNLNRFFGALYRLFFLPYGKNRIPMNAWLARLVPTRTKKLALLNYRGMMVANRQNFPHVYSGGKSDGTERFAWEGTIQKLAKHGVFGTYREARKTRFPQAMILFEMNGIEVKRANDEIKKRNK